MVNFLMSRIVSSILTLLLLSIIVFSMIHLAPGDPARLILPQEATEEDVAQMRRVLGLDKPIFIQYILWLRNAIQLDFGRSLQGERSAAGIFLKRLPASLELALAAIIFAVSFSIPSGIFAAIKRGTYWDFAASFISLFGLSAPRFWVGIILILIFSLGLGWFPAFGRDEGLFYGISKLLEGDLGTIFRAIRSLILPAISLATWSSAIFLKHTRANVLEELGKLYVKTAREKGIGESRVMLFHVLKNACIPIIAVIGLNTGRLIGGAVVVETVFAWPGVGQLVINALWARDYPVIQASICMVGAIITSMFILMDIIYIAIDPRIRTKGIQ